MIPLQRRVQSLRERIALILISTRFCFQFWLRIGDVFIASRKQKGRIIFYTRFPKFYKWPYIPTVGSLQPQFLELPFLYSMNALNSAYNVSHDHFVKLFSNPIIHRIKFLYFDNESYTFMCAIFCSLVTNELRLVLQASKSYSMCQVMSFMGLYKQALSSLFILCTL